MAETDGRDVRAWIMEATSLYPAAVRYGGGYWSEIVANASSHFADVLEALIRVASRQESFREVLGDLFERSRQYVVSNGSTFERALLDFNQAIVTLGRPYSQAAEDIRSSPGTKGDEEGMAGVFRQIADFAANEALRLQGGKGTVDIQAFRRQMEACLVALRRLEGEASPVTPEPGRAPGD